VIQLPDYVVLDPAIDRLPRERLRAMQGERLRTMVQYVYDASPFWQRRLHEARLDPGDVHDLATLPRIPFCTRKELQDDQVRHPPFGSYLACDPARLVRFMMTSGTTGQPLRRVFSGRDWSYALDRLRRSPIAGPGESVVILGPVDGLMGPTASAESAVLSGALVVFAGLYDSRTKVRLLRDVRPSVVSGSASYLLHLIDVAREEGIDLPSMGIRTVVSVGEPGAAVHATRRRLLDGWGAFVRDGYGLTELFPLGGGCRDPTSLHIASDLVVTEIIDPKSGETLPPGEPGEVVYTNIVGDTQPLLRYRTGDIARLAGDEPCACGFTGSRLLHSIEGRIDDMIWLRGMNVFPSAIEAVLRGFVEVDDEYEIVVSGSNLPSLTVRAELRRGTGPTENLAARIAAALASAIRAAAQIELLPYGTLPRPDARTKKRRVVRQPPGSMRV
jgi:phenylacetate-CoA ligase